MRLMKKLILFSILIISLGLLSSCSGNPSSTIAVSTHAVLLTPYSTATPIPTATATPINAPTATPKPTFTPTPKIYVVKEKDTLSVIAYKNGITVEQLKAANPGVDPYMMKIGTELIIPFFGGTAVAPAEPTATAFPLLVGKPYCSPSATGGLYCFGVIENSTTSPVQNITAVFTLTDRTTGESKSQGALFPMNSLGSEVSLPFFTYFAPPVPAQYEISLELKTAVQADAAAAGIVVHEPQVELSADGSAARVSGEGVLTESAEKDNQVVFTFVALDAEKQVVGIRRVQYKIDLSKGSSIPFSVYVYSIGGKIDRVLVYAETLP